MKKFPHIISRVYNTPIQLTVGGFLEVHSLLEKHISGEKTEFLDDLESQPEDQMSIKNGLAIIPIKGVIGNNLSMIEKKCGGTDMRDISSHLLVAQNDSSVDRIVFDIDSPGGFVPGLNALLSQIANSEKPIYSFVEDLCCSLAYHIASGTELIYASPFASAIGNIGVRYVYLDKSQNLAQNGMKYEIFSEGQFKSEGIGGSALSEEFKSYLKQSVLDSYNQFRSDVKAGRPDMSDADLESALVYEADESLAKGLIDGIANNISDIFTITN